MNITVLQLKENLKRSLREPNLRELSHKLCAPLFTAIAENAMEVEVQDSVDHGE